MADETKKPEEEQAMSQSEFVADMAKATGVTKQAAMPEDATPEQKQISDMQGELKLLKFQTSLQESLAAIRSRYPKATDIQIQKYAKTGLTGDIMGNLDAMDAVVRTSMEAEQNDDGNQTLDFVEGESSAAGNKVPQVAGDYSEAIAMGLV